MTDYDRVQVQIKALESIGMDRKRIRAMIVPDLIREEMNEQGVEVARACSEYAYQYIETSNVYFLDLAVCACASQGVLPSQTLFQLISEGAYKRLNGEQRGTAETALKPERKQKALMLIANLRFRGYSMEKASSLAAGWHNKQGEGRPYKASTLEKEYEKEFKSKHPEIYGRMYCYGEPIQSYEDLLFDRWAEWKNENTDNQWDELIASLPEVNEDQLGSRR